MMPLRLIDARTLGFLSRLIVALAIVVATIVLVCLGRSYLGMQSIEVNKQQIEVAKKNLVSMDTEIEQARSIKQAPAPEAKQAIFDFQSTVEGAAHANGAVVEEYASSPEWMPYLSKFHNDPPLEGWQQVAARIQLSGRLPEIYATLRALQKSDIPFEIDSLELSRGQSAAGQSRVSAQINLRVLVRA